MSEVGHIEKFCRKKQSASDRESSLVARNNNGNNTGIRLVHMKVKDGEFSNDSGQSTKQVELLNNNKETNNEEESNNGSIPSLVKRGFFDDDNSKSKTDESNNGSSMPSLIDLNEFRYIDTEVTTTLCRTT